MFRNASFIVGLALTVVATAAQSQTAREIVANADKSRYPEKPFHVTATLTDYKAGRPIGRNIYSVYSKLDPATGQFRDVMLYVIRRATPESCCCSTDPISGSTTRPRTRASVSRPSRSCRVRRPQATF